jgi:nucleoside-diphosphate-sugar epimerase
MTNILITGSESFVGKNLQKLITKNFKVYGIDISSNLKNTFKIDINSPKINNFIKNKKINIIIHLAAISRDEDCKKDVYKCFKNNVLGTLNLIKYAEINKVEQFIFASTEWVYDFTNENKIQKENESINIDSINSEYALSKIISENNLRQHYQNNKRMNFTLLRFGIIYGNRDNNWSAVESLFMKVKRKEIINVGSLKTARQFIHVEDISKGIIQSFNLKGFNVLNLQGNKLISLKQILSTSMKITGNKVLIKETNNLKPSVRKVANLKAKQLINFYSKITILEGLKKFNKYINNQN